MSYIQAVHERAEQTTYMVTFPNKHAFDYAVVTIANQVRQKGKKQILTDRYRVITDLEVLNDLAPFGLGQDDLIPIKRLLGGFAKEKEAKSTLKDLNAENPEELLRFFRNSGLLSDVRALKGPKLVASYQHKRDRYRFQMFKLGRSKYRIVEEEKFAKGWETYESLDLEMPLVQAHKVLWDLMCKRSEYENGVCFVKVM